MKYKTSFGYCLVDENKITLSDDEDFQMQSQFTIVKKLCFIFLKFIIAVTLLFFAFDYFKKKEYVNSIIQLIVSVIFIYESLKTIAAWKHIIRFSIRKNSIINTNIVKDSKVKITFRNDKNEIQALNLFIDSGLNDFLTKLKTS